jgi:hypothetical protein
MHRQRRPEHGRGNRFEGRAAQEQVLRASAPVPAAPRPPSRPRASSLAEPIASPGCSPLGNVPRPRSRLVRAPSCRRCCSRWD